MNIVNFFTIPYHFNSMCKYKTGYITMNNVPYSKFVFPLPYHFSMKFDLSDEMKPFVHFVLSIF